PSLDDVSIHNRAEQPRFVAQARDLIRSASHGHNQRPEAKAISDSRAITFRFQVADAVDHRVECLLSRLERLELLGAEAERPKIFDRLLVQLGTSKGQLLRERA